MMDMVLTKGLTVVELGKVIVNHHRQITPDSKRGRPLAAPKDLNGFVRQLGGYAADFLERDTRVWSTNEHSLTAKANYLSSDEITKERVEEVRKMAADLRKVAIKASERADEADAVYRSFADILKRRESQATRLVAVETIESADTSECDKAMSLFGRDIIGELPSAPVSMAPEIDPIYIYRDRPIDSLEYETTIASMPDAETSTEDAEAEPAMAA
jgi:hypothetical protein